MSLWGHLVQVTAHAHTGNTHFEHSVWKHELRCHPVEADGLYTHRHAGTPQIPVSASLPLQKRYLIIDWRIVWICLHVCGAECVYALVCACQCLHFICVCVCERGAGGVEKRSWLPLAANKGKPEWERIRIGCWWPLTNLTFLSRLCGFPTTSCSRGSTQRSFLCSSGPSLCLSAISAWKSNQCRQQWLQQSWGFTLKISLY